MKTLVIYSLCLAMAAPAVWSADIAPLRGYSSETARTEREWEAKFRAIPDPAALRAYMQRLSARPHHVGSPYDKENAEWIAAKAKEWGLDAQIEIFDVLFPTPKERALEMIEPTHVVAKIAEPAVAGDATSAQQSEQLPVYNAYSIDGDVTAPLVYVNYGIPADYEELDRLGISVKGAIVIARYGGSWRGIKPKVAGEHGAVGCLIYSDPRDDGYAQGDTFPNGPFRPSDGAQRGSVMDMPVYPGDPLTPGVGATKDAKRLPLERSQNPHHDSRAADFLRRRAADAGRAQGTRGARRLARRAAHHLSRGSRARQGPPQAEIQLGHQAALRRHRSHSGQPVPRRVDHPRQSSRRLGQRRRRSGLRHRTADGRDARAGHAPQAGLEAEAHHHLLRVGRRGTGPARLHRVGGDARRRTAAQGGGLHQFGWQRPRLPARGRFAHARKVHQRRGPRHRRPGDQDVRVEAAPGGAAGARYRRRGGRPAGSTHARRPAHRRPRLGLGLHRVSGSPRHRLHRISASAARIRAASTIPSTTISTGTPIFRTRISSTDGRSRRPPAPR